MSTEINPDPDQNECALCGKALAVMGLAIAGVLLYISIDVFTDGGLTRMLTRSTHE